MKILYVAWMTPYDKVRHAGGQTFNYYIKGMARAGHEVTLVSFCMPEELKEIDLSSRGICFCPIVRRKDWKDFLGNFRSLNSKLNPRHRLCNLLSAKSEHRMLSRLRELSAGGYEPEVIILEWTEMLLLIDGVKQIFPKAKIVASEHDVTFQRIGREAATEDTRRKQIQAQNTREREMKAILTCDKVVVHNEKDRVLLLDAGIPEEKIFTIVPFYHQSQAVYSRKNDKVLFFGNMMRKENQEAADWFSRHVMPLIKGLPVEFEVIGNGAKYVESIDAAFSEAMCFVCPLLHGAGIKVKTLEALYSGIPVLANELGIEGIPAMDGEEYFHCEKPEDYEKAIRQIYEGKSTVSGKKMFDRMFDLVSSLENYRNMIAAI